MKLIEIKFTVSTSDDLTDSQLETISEKIANAFDDVDSFARDRVANEVGSLCTVKIQSNV